MKRGILFFLTLILAWSLCAVASAEDGLTVQILSNSELPHVVDQANLLSDDEEAALTALAESISAKQACDVVILTEYGLGGQLPRDYADDYFDYNGYGVGADRSGILLLLDMEERDWWISTRGDAIQAFTDNGIQYLWSKSAAWISGASYKRGFEAFLNTADTMLSAYHGTLSEEELEAFEEDYAEFTGDSDYPTRRKPSVVKTTVFALGIGAVLGFLLIGGAKAQLKSVRSNYSATNYRRPESMHLDGKRDIYLYANTTSRVIETQRTGGGGGSSTHISSSGATHGGGGGKF